MNFIIEYFVKNSRLNYTLMGFLVILGVIAFIKIPKEMFPDATLDSIQVSGSYSGASASSLNNFAVVELEDQISSVSGIKKMTSTIRNGSFSMKLELQEGANKNEVETDVKNAVNNARRYFPSDMNDPIVVVEKDSMGLIRIALSSSALTKEQLLIASKKLKAKISQIKNISEVGIYGDSDLQIDIFIDHKKVDMYGLDSTQIVSAISNLSYIFPVGKIEEKGNHFFVSASNNKFDKEVWLNTILKVDDKKVFLKDIATVSIANATDNIISRLNAQQTVSLRVSKTTIGDAISLSELVKEELEIFKKQNKDINIVISRDSAFLVDERIKVIISNIVLGLVLVGLLMHYLISPRLSFVIILGIPTSFIIGLVLIYATGHSLNLISLMAMLMSLGIVVDDAIIVSENIQRRLEDGESLNDAVINGTKEVVAPVVIASLTTICAFFPMLMIGGEFGEMNFLIPVVVIILILASLLESFVFLPLHSKHILKRKDKSPDWTKAFNFYESILHKVIHYKKSFLMAFFIIMPIVTFYVFSISRFQMMPDLEINEIRVSFKLDDSYSLEETDKISKKYEELFLKHADELYIRNVDAMVGEYINVAGNFETIENGFALELELEQLKNDNFLDNYVNPLMNFTFDFGQKHKKRLIPLSEVEQKIRELIKEPASASYVQEYSVVEERVSFFRTDIELKLNSQNEKKLLEGIDYLKAELAKIKGTEDISDNTNLGEPEHKFTLNSYAYSLGLTDSEISNQISSFFIEKEQATTFNNTGVIKIKTQSLYKDSQEELKHFLINVDDKKIELQELVDFKIERNFAKIEKENGQIIKTVFANVDRKNISANEVLEQLAPAIKVVEERGVNVGFGGEREKSSEMATQMITALIISLFCIFIVLLINFPSFKSALIIISVIPFTAFGAILGHLVVGVNLTADSFIGMLGLAGVVINDGIVMLDFLKDTTNKEQFYKRAKQRLKPILITSITTILGLFSLMFFATGESVMLQPIAISLGFGVAWGTILNLIYVPALYATLYKIKD